MNVYPYNPLTAQQVVNPYVMQPINNPVITAQQMPQMVQPQGPHREIDVVNGKESALSFLMGPNSSAILVDELKPKIWMVTTDSSGFKAVKGFRVIPDDEDEPKQQTSEKPKENDLIEKLMQQNKTLEERLKKLEERMNGNGQSASKSSWQNKPGNGNAQSNDRNGQVSKGSDGSN